MNVIQRFDKLCIEAESDINQGLNDAAKLVSIYSFYHYFNGDESQLDEIQNSLCYYEPEEWFLAAVLRSTTIDGNAVDFVTVVEKTTLQTSTDEELKALVLKTAKDIGVVVLHEPEAKIKVRVVYDRLDIRIGDDDSAFFTLKILCNWTPDPEEKIRLQTIVANCGVRNNKVGFELIFADDIEQEIDDIESPKEYVSSGFLNLFGNSSICKIGEEGRFLTVISARSLKMLFFQFATRGLFASNLRFFISAKKIDPKIINSIQNESENFVYYNNGIIITCDECHLVGNQLRLTNFSVVNGGQTTNLIGRTPFDGDFGVVCKVITSKYEDKVEKVEFLAKVAEASNMQKPINAKDLIANRKEQRLLKEQFSRCGIFLKVKRGEKINKSLYPEPWQNASNDEIAQMIYSCIYQMPGSAKNGRTALLSNERTYDQIFKSEYDDSFLTSLQHLKIGFANWKKELLKKEVRSSPKVGLARTGDLLSFALVCLIVKLETNKSLFKSLLEIPHYLINNENEDAKFMIGQNDIGRFSLVNPALFGFIGKKTFNPVFDLVFDNILIPSYHRFKRDYPNYAYVNFNKAQSYYFNYVFPYAVKYILTNESDIRSKLSGLLNFAADSSEGFEKHRSFDDYLPGLNHELSEFRAKKVQGANGRIKNSDVFTNMQLTYVCRYLPKTKMSLEMKCKFKEQQIQDYGDEIIRIVEKYCDLSQFEEGADETN